MLRPSVLKTCRLTRVPSPCCRRIFRQVSSRFKPRSRSTKSVPFRWSVSWQRARASRPVPSISRTLPEASAARTRTRVGAQDLLREIGDGKAALLFLLLPGALEDDRVHQDDHRAGIGADREVDDRHPLVDADLRSGQADAGRRVAGLDHVGDQTGEVLRGRVDLGVVRHQPRIAVVDDVSQQAVYSVARVRGSAAMSSLPRSLSPGRDTASSGPCALSP